MRRLFFLLPATVLAVAGCGPRRGDDADLKDFLGEIHFVDKDSLSVICFDIDDRGMYDLTFKTASVDFVALSEFDTIRPQPSQTHIAYIEQVTKYRFKAPADEYIFLQRVEVRKYGPLAFKFVKDGDDYIVHCLFTKKNLSHPLRRRRSSQISHRVESATPTRFR